MATTKKTKKSKAKKDKESKEVVITLPTVSYYLDAHPLMEAGKDFIITRTEWTMEGAKGMTHLARAIRLSPTLKQLTITQLKKILPSEVQEIIEVLSNHKTITSLKIDSRPTTNDPEYKILASVLRKNNRITFLELNCAELTLEAATMLSEALKVNTSLDVIKFIATKLDVPKLTILAEGLKVHPKISSTQYYSEQLDKECGKIICSIVQANPRIKHLELSRSLQDFSALEEFMKTNTTLETIGFYGVVSANLAQFWQALAVNKGLKEFTMQNGYWDDYTCKSLAKVLKTNTSLQILRADGKYLTAEHTRLLSKGLAANNTLKVLDFRENELNSVIYKAKNPKGKPTGTGALCAALKNNTSITDVDISRNKLYQRGYEDIAALLKENKGIRHLKMDLFIGHTTINESLRLICESLKVNRTLISLKLYQCVKFSDTAWSYIADLMNVNRTLSSLEIHTDDIPEHIQKRIRKNKRRREKKVRSTKMLIRMIALRPKAYFAVLPIEIWAYIFRYCEIPAVDIDFEKEFLAELK